MRRNYFTSLLEQLEVDYTPEYAGRLFQRHPYRYTLFGLRSMLRHYGISSEAVRVADKSSGLDRLASHLPFEAEVSRDIVMVTSVDGDVVEFRRYGELVRMERQSFELVWSGVALVVTDLYDAHEPDYLRNRRKHLLGIAERYGAMALAALIILVAAVSAGVSRSPWLSIQFVLCLVGAVFSLLLAGKSLNLKVRMADKACGLIQGNDCSDILGLPASRLFGRYSWAGIGVVYFAAYTLFIISAPASFLNLMPWISLCAAVYPLWSVWYQKFVARKWCVLCLCVQGVLLLQAAAGCLQLHFAETGTLDPVVAAMFAATCVLGGLLIRPVGKMMQILREAPLTEERYISLRFDDAVIINKILNSKNSKRNEEIHALGNKGIHAADRASDEAGVRRQRNDRFRSEKMCDRGSEVCDNLHIHHPETQ